MKKAYFLIALLVILSPFFAWAADLVGYSEPLENAAEEAGASEHEGIFHGVFPDYTVPSMNPYLSALITGVIGCLIIIIVTMVLRKIKHG